MLIIADENIPYVQTAFASVGEVRTVVGRQLTRATLAEAEILLVRSITAVNIELLAGSAVRFVGTATIGYDHVDLAYLTQQGIGFANAPGCNAIAAAEYVISALLVVAERQGFELPQKTVGIIGCGNVGSRVLTRLRALGVECVVYDPPLQEQTGGAAWTDLDTVLSAADIVTVHVPLTTGGAYPTYHLINAAALAKLKPAAILINTSRGQVVDEVALWHQLMSVPEMTVILDVWQNEPGINSALLQRAALGTPHIAGYSLEGKLRGTEMLYTAVCEYFNQSASWPPAAGVCLPLPPLTRLSFSVSVEDQAAIQTAVLACYDVRRDDAALRLISAPNKLEVQFDNLRKYYPVRREFSSVEVELPGSKQTLANQLRGLGFKVVKVDR